MARLYIGMPVYNGEEFLSGAIEALLGQTFKDFTLYISDNASTDTTQKICEAYAARDPRIYYYRQPENLGLFLNFKYTLDQADTEYFMWAAHDDVRDKEYLETCINKLDQDKTIALATTTAFLMDAQGQILAHEKEVGRLSGKGLLNVIRYTLQAEGLGKPSLIYGVWRTLAARAVWDAYPQRKVWGMDYHCTLALVERYGINVDPRPLFKKRLGGYGGSPTDQKRKVRQLSYKDRNNTFPFKRFNTYFKGHMEASRDTPYQLLVATLLFMRLPWSFFVYAKERNYKKFFKKLFHV